MTEATLAMDGRTLVQAVVPLLELRIVLIMSLSFFCEFLLPMFGLVVMFLSRSRYVAAAILMIVFSARGILNFSLFSLILSSFSFCIYTFFYQLLFNFVASRLS